MTERLTKQIIIFESKKNCELSDLQTKEIRG